MAATPFWLPVKVLSHALPEGGAGGGHGGEVRGLLDRPVGVRDDQLGLFTKPYAGSNALFHGLPLRWNFGIGEAPRFPDADEAKPERYRLWRYHSSVIFMPSSKEKRGVCRRSRTARVVSAWESRTSPLRGGPYLAGRLTPSIFCRRAQA